MYRTYEGEEASRQAKERVLTSTKPHKRKFAIECIRQGRYGLLKQWIEDGQHVNQINIRSNGIGTLLEFAIKFYNYNIPLQTKEAIVKLIVVHSNSTTVKAANTRLDDRHSGQYISHRIRQTIKLAAAPK